MDAALYLLRHAKSSWDDRTIPDRERPLAPRGRHACELLADHLLREGIAPELVLCSSSARTRETLEGIASSFAGKSEIVIEDGLYTADAEQLLNRLRAVEGSVASVMLIGHHPAIPDLALNLVRRRKDTEALSRKFPTGALATLTVPRPWDTWPRVRRARRLREAPRTALRAELRQLGVGFGPSVAEELPEGSHVVDQAEVEVGCEDFVFAAGCSRNDSQRWRERLSMVANGLKVICAPPRPSIRAGSGKWRS